MSTSKLLRSASPLKQSNYNNIFTIKMLMSLPDIGPKADEFRKAYFTERAVIRYRLFALRTYAESRIRELRLQANALYNKMDDWIIFGIKNENDAVYSIVVQRL